MDFLIIKLDANGTELWRHNHLAQVASIDVDASGNVVAANVPTPEYVWTEAPLNVRPS